MKLSIIIPVYKAEGFLNKCIDSILTQSFKEWELILIDDGSPDLSGVICDRYAKDDKRIKVIHKKNEGVSVARNRGLEIAKGEYITFIDSDDSIEGNLQSLLSDVNSDLIVFDSISYKIDGEIKYWYRIEQGSISTPRDINGFITNYINYFVLDGPCGKLFKRSVIGDLRFPPGQPLGEDNVFMLSYITKCRTVELRHDVRYVIDDHYDNDYRKYKMPAVVSALCLNNIMKAYNCLEIKVPSFEKKMFHSFYTVIDPNSDLKLWYNDSVVKQLENKYIRLEAKSFRAYYKLGKYTATKRIGYYLFWHFFKIMKKIRQSKHS